MPGFEGKWNLESSENFEDYMKALGVGMVMRKLGATAKPVLTFSRNGDLWKVKSESTVKNTEFEFKFGQEFDEGRADGVKVKSTITEESPTKWMHVQKADIPTSLVRELVDDDTLKITMKAKEAVSTRVYKRAK